MIKMGKKLFYVKRYEPIMQNIWLSRNIFYPTFQQFVKIVLPSSEVVAVIVAFSPFPFDVEALI